MPNERPQRISIFRQIGRMLEQSPGKVVQEETLLGQLAVQFPHERQGRLLRTVIAWGRYSGLYANNSAHKTLRMAEATPAKHR